MNKILRIFGFGFILIFILFPKNTSAQNTNNFVINSFTADYYLDRTEKNIPIMQVKERIVATFPDYNQNHGILRAIPTEYKGQNLNLEIISIKNERGAIYKYSSDDQNDNLI